MKVNVRKYFVKYFGAGIWIGRNIYAVYAVPVMREKKASDAQVVRRCFMEVLARRRARFLILYGGFQRNGFYEQCASTLVTVSLWVKSPRLTRLLVVPVCTAFIIYDVFIDSYAGIINESISLVSIIIAFFRNDYKGHSASAE